MKAAKVISTILSIFITLPIWFFLMHTALVGAHADRLVWFLYWVYVPVCTLVSVIQKVTEK
jgi:hypothetical protein